MKPRVPPPLPAYLKFLSPFEPHVRDLALATRKLVLDEALGATELIYDAYNAVAAGFSFTGRPGDSFVHIAVYAHWVNLGFNQGSELNDPDGMLEGSGRRIRHTKILAPADVQQPILRAFVRAAAARARRPVVETHKRRTGTKSVVRAIYARKRRPAPET